MAVCPKCSTTFTIFAGQPARCPKCGYTMPAPKAGSPATGTRPVTGAPAPPRAGSPPAGNRPANPPGYGQPQGTGYGGYPPYGGAGMQAPLKRPGLTTTSAVLGFIAAGLFILVGIIAMAASAMIADLLRQAYPGLGEVATTLFIVIGAILLALGVLWVFISLGILKGQQWARWTAVVLAGLETLNVLLGIANNPSGAILPLAYNIMLIVGLVIPAANVWFKARSQQRAMGLR